MEGGRGEEEGRKEVVHSHLKDHSGPMQTKKSQKNQIEKGYYWQEQPVT